MDTAGRALLSLVILGAFLTIQGPAFAQIPGADPVSVTGEDASFGKQGPRLCINSLGEPVVFWHRTGNEAFFISTLKTEGFTPPVEIPLNGINPNLWGGSLVPSIAANGGHMYVTFEVYGEAIYTVHSSDDGESWDDPVAAFTPPDGRRATIPAVGVDAAGQAYVVYVNTNASEGDAYYGLVHSEDLGQSFGEEVNVSLLSAGQEVCECCNGHIAIAENGAVYVAFRNNDNNTRDIWLARSEDGGQTFTAVFDVDETDWMENVCPSNGPHFDFFGDDQLVTGFFSAEGEGGSGAYATGFDMAASIVGPTTAIPASSETSGAQNRVRIAGSETHIAMVWQETFESSLEIGMAFSSDGVAGLAGNSFLLTDEVFNQRFPDIIEHNGTFHVVYEDSNSNTVMYLGLDATVLSVASKEMTRPEAFPNPCRQSLNLQTSISEALDNISVLDVMGKRFECPIQSRSDNGVQISVEHLPVGCYFAEVSSGFPVYIRFLKY